MTLQNGNGGYPSAREPGRSAFCTSSSREACAPFVAGIRPYDASVGHGAGPLASNERDLDMQLEASRLLGERGPFRQANEVSDPGSFRRRSVLPDEPSACPQILGMGALRRFRITLGTVRMAVPICPGEQATPEPAHDAAR